MMVRRLLIEILLFALPFLLYFGARFALRRLRPDIAEQPPASPQRIVQLTIAGVALAIGGFAIGVFLEPRHDGEVYVPAHMKNGELVPGRYIEAPPGAVTPPPGAQEKPPPPPDTDKTVLEGHP